MKQNLKKIFAIGTAVLVPLSIIGIGAAIYFSTSKVSKISSKGIYSIRINETLNDGGYKFDYSASYGSTTSNDWLSLLINNEILHLKTSGEFKYDAINHKVIEPSYESYKFANAKAIVLTFISSSVTKEEYLKHADGSQKLSDDKYFELVFDSDKDEINGNKNDNDLVVSKDSNDVKSINNSKVFWKIISNGFLSSKIDLDNETIESLENKINNPNKDFALVSMGLTFDKGRDDKESKSYWVDSNGKKTKYEISAYDMFYSSQRTRLFDRDYRRSNGGSAELDKYFINKTQTIKLFGETRRYPNEYLLDFFGVNKNAMYDEATAIQDVDIDGKIADAFTITFNVFDGNDVNQNFVSSVPDVIKKYLVNSIHFSLAPSQYIKEKFAHSTSTSTPVGSITSQANEFGIYTYAQTRNTTLFASNYVPIESEGNREIFEYNKYFANKEWVKSVEGKENNYINEPGYRTINKVILEYSGSIDSSTFINQSYTSFLNGTLSEVDYSSLSDAQKQKLYGNSSNIEVLLQNARDNGLRETKKINISTMTSRMTWQANPINNSDYTFNEAYSQILFGCSKDQLNKGTAVTTNNYFANEGFNFRLLIQASINWNQFIIDAYSGTRDPWLSGAAPNAKFSSTWIDSKTPADFNEGDENGKGSVNNLIWFDETGTKQISTLKDMKLLSSFGPNEILNHPELGADEVQNLQRTKSRSLYYKKIQKAMTALLDQIYSKNNWSYDVKIEWTIPYPFADQDETKCNATEYLVNNVINTLDIKGRIKASFFKPTTREQMLAQINQSRGAYNAKLWSYDYEGIGSYIAAFVGDGGGLNLANAFGLFSKKESDSDDLFTSQNNVARLEKSKVMELKKQFPRFSELSEFIRESMNSILGNSDEVLKVENWDLITNKQNNSIKDFFKEYLNPNNIDPISTLSALFKAFESEASFKNDDLGWVDLINELNAIKGVSIDTEASTEKLESVNYILRLKDYLIPLSKSGVHSFPDFLYKVDK